MAKKRSSHKGTSKRRSTTNPASKKGLHKKSEPRKKTSHSKGDSASSRKNTKPDAQEPTIDATKKFSKDDSTTKSMRDFADLNESIRRSVSSAAMAGTMRGFADLSESVRKSLSGVAMAGTVRGFADLNESIRKSFSNTTLSETMRSIRDTQNFVARNEFMNSDELDRVVDQDSKIINLKKEVSNLYRQLDQERENNNDVEARLNEKNDELLKAQDTRNIQSRVLPEAAKLIREDSTFREKFNNTEQVQATILSIDIRRSTDLMLKAKSAHDFSRFIDRLSEKLKNIVLKNFGIFDKFTGDGILSFFPHFYSGEHSIYYAMMAAEECHECFREHYKSNRSSFNAVRLDVGLGIGIDHGSAHLIQVNGDLTVIGQPVVYACRLSNAPPDKTLLNQGAFDAASADPPVNIDFKETSSDFKHEGLILAYESKVNWTKESLKRPFWFS